MYSLDSSLPVALAPYLETSLSIYIRAFLKKQRLIHYKTAIIIM